MKRGFTIIELLVVIAIIGVLASLIAVNIKNAKKNAKQKKAMEFAHTVRVSLGDSLVGEWTFDDSSDLGKDSSGYENHSTNHGVTPANGIIRGAGDFDGDDIEIPDSNSLDIVGNEITLELWAYPQNVSGEQYFISKYNGDNVTDGYTLLITANIYFRLGDGANRQQLTCGHGMSANNWYHWVATYDGSLMRVYRNGEQLSTTHSFTGDIAANTRNIKIGEQISGAYSFDGAIDEVRIYDRALTTAEIQKHYAEGVVKHNIVLK